jgi:presequence protease
VLVLANHLGDGILYRKIRVEGGAYGCMSMYNHALGQFAMVSYRDPNLEKTLEVYDTCLEDLLAEDLSADVVRKAVISTTANLDRPMDPATQGMAALERHLAGLGDADRQRFRDAVLKVDAAAMRRGVREILQPALSRARDAVFAPTERIEAANAGLPRRFEVEGLE